MAHSTRWRYLRLLYLWHRRLGIAALALFVILIVTGVALNHSQQLRLDQRPVVSPALLAWYGMKPPSPERVFMSDGHYLSQVSGQLYLDTRPLSHAEEPLVGAASLDDMVLAVTSRRLLAYTWEGELIESLPLPKRLAGKATGAGLWQRRLVVASHDRTIMSTDGNLLEWRTERDVPRAEWSSPTSLPAEMADALRSAESPLHMERVILDLHSGRLFGRYGTHVMDAAAGALLLLGLSGGYLWLRQRRRRRHATPPAGQ